MIDPKKHLTAAAPAEDAVCGLCETVLDKEPSLQLDIKILFKQISKRVCLVCSREVRDLIDLRIKNAKDGDFGR